ncbi:MAG TPA: polyprenyl synthetase family protein [Burkholderiales bacterium]|mgnify:CR=1 FL=1|nr:polyprenyl synthetase family protein [Burkholderiales bacterium]
MNRFNLELKKIEDKLIIIFSQNHIEDFLLLDAMRYSTLNGGKRLRPLLTLASGKLSMANENILIDVGCAIELMHCYSLIHDDLPAMDNADMRRSVLTCHKKYNEAIGILAGDALQSLAFELLSADSILLNPVTKLKIIELIAKSIGYNGMAGGQAIDLIATGVKLDLEAIKKMHALKTGALIKAAILSGYLCGDKFDFEVYTNLSKIADNIGLLFQIKDDILDVTKDTATLGKIANKDIINDKSTYVSTIGIEPSFELATNIFNDIINKLNDFNNSDDLIELTNSIYNRNN